MVVTSVFHTAALAAAGPSGEAHRIALDIALPDDLTSKSVMFFCVPGGGVTRQYFDLDAGAGHAFSFSRAMTEAGHVVVSVDPPGVGDSSRPSDGFGVTTEVQAHALHGAFRFARAQTAMGVALAALPAIGVGHSAGAMLATVQQSLHRDFAAMLLLCFGIDGLPGFLDPEHRAALDEPDRIRARLPELARKRFDEPYFGIEMRGGDAPAERALRAVRSDVVAVVGLHAMTPGNIAPEIAALDVPVFLGVGAQDMTGPPHRLGAAYRSCGDFTLYVSPQAGHHIFVAADASRLFRRITSWTAGIEGIGAGTEIRVDGGAFAGLAPCGNGPLARS